MKMVNFDAVVHEIADSRTEDGKMSDVRAEKKSDERRKKLRAVSS